MPSLARRSLWVAQVEFARPGEKGTIRFPPDKPRPDALLRKIVKARVAENSEWD
jgi:uncharacterized protein YdhG (YjbR/CyaY superfamily)